MISYYKNKNVNNTKIKIYYNYVCNVINNNMLSILNNLLIKNVMSANKYQMYYINVTILIYVVFIIAINAKIITIIHNVTKLINVFFAIRNVNYYFFLHKQNIK